MQFVVYSSAIKARWNHGLHLAATCCNTLQHTATHHHTLQHTATRCHTHTHTVQHDNWTHDLHHTATHCNTLHHTLSLSHLRTIYLSISLTPTLSWSGFPHSVYPPHTHTHTGFNKIIKSDIRDRMNDYILHMIGFRICIPAHIMICIIYVYQDVNSHREYTCGLPKKKNRPDNIFIVKWIHFFRQPYS